MAMTTEGKQVNDYLDDAITSIRPTKDPNNILAASMIIAMAIENLAVTIGSLRGAILDAGAHPLQGQTLDGIASGLDMIATAISNHGENG